MARRTARETVDWAALAAEGTRVPIGSILESLTGDATLGETEARMFVAAQSNTEDVVVVMIPVPHASVSRAKDALLGAFHALRAVGWPLVGRLLGAGR